jgi:hypothetical protein
MKLKVALLALVGILVIAGSAEASRWYVRYGQAKNTAKAYSKQACERDSECIAWGAGKCSRRSSARFDCIVAAFYPGVEAGEEIVCQRIAHVGVNRGFVQVLSVGRQYCFTA